MIYLNRIDINKAQEITDSTHQKVSADEENTQCPDENSENKDLIDKHPENENGEDENSSKEITIKEKEDEEIDKPLNMTPTEYDKINH